MRPLTMRLWGSWGRGGRAKRVEAWSELAQFEPDMRLFVFERALRERSSAWPELLPVVGGVAPVALALCLNRWLLPQLVQGWPTDLANLRSIALLALIVVLHGWCVSAYVLPRIERYERRLLREYLQFWGSAGHPRLRAPAVAPDPANA